MNATETPTMTRTVLGSGVPCYAITTGPATLDITDLGLLSGKRQWAYTLRYRTTVMSEAIVTGETLTDGVAAAVRGVLNADTPTHRVPTLPAYRAFEALAALDLTAMELALGAPALHGVIYADGHDGRYRLYTIDYLPFGALPPHGNAGPGTVALNGWVTSTSTTSRGVASTHLALVDNGRVTIGAHRGYAGSGPRERHELDGTTYATQADAARALYEAGLTGFMVFERDAARLGLVTTEGN